VCVCVCVCVYCVHCVCVCVRARARRCPRSVGMRFADVLDGAAMFSQSYRSSGRSARAYTLTHTHTHTHTHSDVLAELAELEEECEGKESEYHVKLLVNGMSALAWVSVEHPVVFLSEIVNSLPVFSDKIQLLAKRRTGARALSLALSLSRARAPFSLSLARALPLLHARSLGVPRSSHMNPPAPASTPPFGGS